MLPVATRRVRVRVRVRNLAFPGMMQYQPTPIVDSRDLPHALQAVRQLCQSPDMPYTWRATP
jgi:hypothetical protein